MNYVLILIDKTVTKLYILIKISSESFLNICFIFANYYRIIALYLLIITELLHYIYLLL